MQLNVIKKFIVELQDYGKYDFIILFFILSTFFFSELRLNFQLNLKICFLPLMLSGKMVFDGNFNQIGDTINRNATLEIQFGLWFFNYFIKNVQADVINLSVVPVGVMAMAVRVASLNKSFFFMMGHY